MQRRTAVVLAVAFALAVLRCERQPELTLFA
jgi:hypothetical protein